jgi:hypothetical protein
MNSHEDFYLDLMKKALCGGLDIYFPNNWSCSDDSFNFDKAFHKRPLSGSALTMNGTKSLNFIQHEIRRLVEKQIEGDILIAGCWRGGMAIFSQACLRVYEPNLKRKIWCADTFPKRQLDWKKIFPLKALIALLSIFPKSITQKCINKLIINQGFSGGIISEYDFQNMLKYIKNMPWSGSHTSDTEGISDMLTGFERYELMGDNIIPLVGFFSDTLKKADIKKLALLISDSDLYHSTLETLEMTYPKLSAGAGVIIDDYQLIEDCRKAVDEYRGSHSIDEAIGIIDRSAIHWQKS